MASDKSRLLVRVEVYLRLSGRKEGTGGGGGIGWCEWQKTGPNVWPLNNLPARSAGVFSTASRVSFDLFLNHRIV